MASLGANFTQLMKQAADALPPNTINESMVGEVAGQLNSLQGLMALGQYVDPITGQIRHLHAGSIILNDQGLRVDGDDTFAVFTGDQTYVGTTVSDGDLIIGNSSADQANIFWDKSAGELQFRGGTTKHGWIGTTGAAVFGDGTVTLNDQGVTIGEGAIQVNWLKWETSTGMRVGDMYAYKSAENQVQTYVSAGKPGAASSWTYADIVLHANAKEDSSGEEFTGTLKISASTASGNVFTLYSKFEDVVKFHAQANQSAFEFNYGKADLDFNVYGTTGLLLKADAGSSYVRLGDTVTNYTQIADDGTQTLVGTAKVNNHITIGAMSWHFGVSAPSESDIGIFHTLAFDKDSDDEVHYDVLIPWRMEAGTNIKVGVDWAYTGASTNSAVCWAMDYHNVSAGESLTAASTTIVVNSAGSHSTGVLIRTEFAATITGSVAHDVLGMHFYRDVSGDSFGEDAELVAIHLEYIRDKHGE